MHIIANISIFVLLLSVVAIFYPFKPFEDRATSLGLALALSVIVGGLTLAGHIIGAKPNLLVSVLYRTDSPQTQHTAEAEPVAIPTALTNDIRISSTIPSVCGNEGLALRDLVGVTGEHQIRQEPRSDAPLVINEKATNALGRTHYHVVDNSTTVIRECVQAQWTRVRISSPDWLTHVMGWVENDALREIERTSDGTRRFVEADFWWDEGMLPFKDEIISIVNRIATKNHNCSAIDPSSTAKSGSRSQPNDPVFYVTCGSGASAFNVWFRPEEAARSQEFVAISPVDKASATDLCEASARAAAINPSTVNFSRILDLAYIPHVFGRARLVSTFAASNRLGQELEYRIDCLFDGHVLVETNIAEM